MARRAMPGAEHGVAGGPLRVGLVRRPGLPQNLNMFKNGSAGTWMLIGLVGSVLFRLPLWLVTLGGVGPLLGPIDVALFWSVGDTVVTSAIWVGDAIASVVCAVTTGVACVGLRGDRAWASRLAEGLAWWYIACNTAAAVACGVLMPDWPLLATPFAVYLVSLVVAILAVRQLRAHRRSPMVVGITALRRRAAAAGRAT